MVADLSVVFLGCGCGFRGFLRAEFWLSIGVLSSAPSKFLRAGESLFFCLSVDVINSRTLLRMLFMFSSTTQNWEMDASLVSINATFPALIMAYAPQSKLFLCCVLPMAYSLGVEPGFMYSCILLSRIFASFRLRSSMES